MNTLFVLGLALVMVVQGAALQPRDLNDWGDNTRAVLSLLLLRLLLLPVATLALGKWLLVLLDIDRFAGTGLVLAFTAPPAVAAVALAAVAGGSVPLIGRLAAVGTVVSALVGPFVLGPLVMYGPIEPAFVLVLLLVILPFGAGLLLRQKIARFRRMPAIMASLVTGAMMLMVFLLGWTDDGPAILLATAVMVVAALALTVLCASVARLTADARISLCLSTLIPVGAVPMALAMIAGNPTAALAGAFYVVLGYLLALILIGFRLRRARRP